MLQLNLCPIKVDAAGFFILDKKRLSSVSEIKDYLFSINNLISFLKSFTTKHT